MKILIFGKDSKLAKSIMRFLPDSIALSKKECNICNMDKVENFIYYYRPNFVINCAAYNDVDGAETDSFAHLINGYAVGGMSGKCWTYGIKFITFSTNFVFDGTKEEGYTEKDIPNPISEYGKSKALGEKLIQENCGEFYIIRTSWLYDDDYLEKLKSYSTILAPIDQFGFPSHTRDVAKSVYTIINYGLEPDIYHFTSLSKIPTSKYDFLFKYLGDKVKPCLTKDLKQKALRPKYGYLINTKLPVI